LPDLVVGGFCVGKTHNARRPVTGPRVKDRSADATRQLSSKLLGLLGSMLLMPHGGVPDPGAEFLESMGKLMALSLLNDPRGRGHLPAGSDGEATYRWWQWPCCRRNLLHVRVREGEWRQSRHVPPHHESITKVHANLPLRKPRRREEEGRGGASEQ
jgi:hypothetical protein